MVFAALSTTLSFKQVSHGAVFHSYFFLIYFFVLLLSLVLFAVVAFSSFVWGFLARARRRGLLAWIRYLSFSS